MLNYIQDNTTFSRVFRHHLRKYPQIGMVAMSSSLTSSDLINISNTDLINHLTPSFGIVDVRLNAQVVVDFNLLNLVKYQDAPNTIFDNGWVLNPATIFGPIPSPNILINDGGYLRHKIHTPQWIKYETLRAMSGSAKRIMNNLKQSCGLLSQREQRTLIWEPYFKRILEDVLNKVRAAQLDPNFRASRCKNFDKWWSDRRPLITPVSLITPVIEVAWDTQPYYTINYSVSNSSGIAFRPYPDEA